MELKYEAIISKMSLEEKAYMMSGRDTWSTVPYEKYGIPPMVMSDGPHGLRRQLGKGDQLGINGSLPATCFPTAATVANSWDEALGEEIGAALADEAVTMDVGAILGPGLNIKRSPLCGRNFEYKPSLFPRGRRWQILALIMAFCPAIWCSAGRQTG